MVLSAVLGWMRIFVPQKENIMSRSSSKLIAATVEPPSPSSQSDNSPSPEPSPQLEQPSNQTSSCLPSSPSHSPKRAQSDVYEIDLSGPQTQTTNFDNAKAHLYALLAFFEQTESNCRENDSLEARLRDAEQKQDDLEITFGEIQRALETRRMENVDGTELAKQYKKLQEEHTKLQEEHTKLQEDHTWLQVDQTSLQKAHTGLLERYMRLCDLATRIENTCYEFEAPTRKLLKILESSGFTQILRVWNSLSSGTENEQI